MLAWVVQHADILQTSDVILLLSALQVRALVPFRSVPAEPPQPLAGISFSSLARKEVDTSKTPTIVQPVKPVFTLNMTSVPSALYQWAHP